jgi:hypothetical protein
MTKRRPKGTPAICLKCRREFFSRDKTRNRLCQGCNASNSELLTYEKRMRERITHLEEHDALIDERHKNA